MKRLLIAPLALAAALAGGAVRIMQDQCGPFTDVTPSFCPYILELYYLGITAGTSATTFSPDDPLTRGQAAVFVAKGLNQALSRSSRRAALGQWWTTQNAQSLGLSDLGAFPYHCQSDGADIWVTHLVSGTVDGMVSRVRASDGRLLEVWTTPTQPTGVLAAMGRIFLTGDPDPGNLYMIDPSQPAGAVTTVATGLGPFPHGIAFDGSRIWTAADGVVSIVTPGATLPWAVTSVTGFDFPSGMLYDGSNIWISDFGAGTLERLDANGNVLQTVLLSGRIAGDPVFDGANIWVPVFETNSLDVVHVSNRAVLASLTGNGLTNPVSAAFDGERILVSNANGGSVSVWRAADLAPSGSFQVGGVPQGVCSDGLNFWVALEDAGKLARF